MKVTLSLANGWRQREDLSWRASTWGLRRMAAGGLVLEDLPPADRKKAGIPEMGMALRVRHVGEFGPHAAAQKAGFRLGDMVVSFDAKTDLRRETDLLAYAVNHRTPGDRVAVTVVRDGKKINLMLPMQH
jgi:serine protease Do